MGIVARAGGWDRPLLEVLEAAIPLAVEARSSLRGRERRRRPLPTHWCDVVVAMSMGGESLLHVMGRGLARVREVTATDQGGCSLRSGRDRAGPTAAGAALRELSARSARPIATRGLAGRLAGR